MPIAAIVAGLTFFAVGADETPSLLTSRGLERSGNQFVVAEESSLVSQLRGLKSIQAKYLEAFRAAYLLESQYLALYEEFANLKLQQKQLDLERQAAGANSPKQMAIWRADDQVRRRQSEIEDLMRRGNPNVTAAFAVLVEVRKAYVDAIRQCNETGAEGLKKYAEVSNDEPAKAALEEYNKTADKPFIFGPSRTFTNNIATAKKYLDFLQTCTVPIRVQGEWWHIEASINRKSPVDVCIATGYTTNFLTETTAAAAGIMTSDANPVGSFKDSGATSGYQVKRARINSIKIGDFEYEDTDGVVFGADSIIQENRIGIPFLRNYIWEIDNPATKLTLTELNDPAAKKPNAKVKKRKS